MQCSSFLFLFVIFSSFAPFLHSSFPLARAPGAWQKTLPKSLELGSSQLASHSRLKLGPSSSLVNTRLELLGQKAARQTKGRPVRAGEREES